MKANPGGNLDPDCVYGRDALIEMIWDRLESQSILLNAERRIGKTQVLRKMQAEPRNGWRPVFRDLEKIHSAQEFAELVYDEVQQFLNSGTRAKNFIQKLLEDNETDYVNLAGRTWKKLLTSAIQDLMKANRPERLVFFWDEVPYMLGNILRSEEDGPRVAAEVLDTIRSLRVEHPQFRVIFTGSIGIHHILGVLSAAGIPTSAKNDMFQLSVTPLAPPDAEKLAADLLTGEGISSPNLSESAATIAEEVDYFPYYIHHVVAGLRLEQLSAAEENIKDLVARQLVDANDPWQLAHYRTRLTTYYPDNEDADHYLSRETDGTYRFRFPLIRRWWKLDRGL